MAALAKSMLLRTAPALRTAAPRSMATTSYGHDGMKNTNFIDVPREGTPSVESHETPFLGSNLVMQWMEGIKRYGLQRTIVQAYTMGNIKFGKCVGEDVNGNRYYENMDYPHGQHRWVEFKDIHNPDVSTIPPEWHGWHTQMQDAPGSSVKSFLEERLAVSHLVAGDSADSSKVYTDHVGLNATGYEMEKEMNKSTTRLRGYKIGGTMNMGPNDKEEFHVHPGHALNKGKTGRYTGQKKMHLWDPNADEETNPEPKPFRSLDLN